MEITKGSKVKYELDKKIGLIKVCMNTIFTSVHFEEMDVPHRFQKEEK